MKTRRFGICIFTLSALLAGLTLLHLQIGFADISLPQLLRILRGAGTAQENLMVFDFRMVRTCLAILIGSGLALSGTVFQTVTHNELASPGVLGVNAGAGLGVMLLVYLSGPEKAPELWAMPLAAIAGAFLSASVIYRLSCRTGRNLSTYTLILTGIAMSAGIHALQLLLIVRLDPQKFQTINTWIIGTISGTTWQHVVLILPLILLCGLFLLSRHMDLNLLSLLEENMIGLGMHVNHARLIYLMTAVIIAACCVAIGGSISFVGLIAPHIARRLVGVQHIRQLPAAALLGAILVLSADCVGRTIAAPDELLLGTVLALVGAPYFLYILSRKTG